MPKPELNALKDLDRTWVMRYCTSTIAKVGVVKNADLTRTYNEATYGGAKSKLAKAVVF